jgi:hypothetical protein
MLLNGQGSITNAYRVEASGWDSTQSLFVETCKLKCRCSNLRHFPALKQKAHSQKFPNN